MGAVHGHVWPQGLQDRTNLERMVHFALAAEAETEPVDDPEAPRPHPQASAAKLMIHLSMKQ